MRTAEIKRKTAETDITLSLSLDGKGKADIKDRKLSKKDKDALIERMTKEMKDAARRLEFEQAAFLRDKIKEIRESK